MGWQGLDFSPGIKSLGDWQMQAYKDNLDMQAKAREEAMAQQKIGLAQQELAHKSEIDERQYPAEMVLDPYQQEALGRTSPTEDPSAYFQQGIHDNPAVAAPAPQIQILDPNTGIVTPARQGRAPQSVAAPVVPSAERAPASGEQHALATDEGRKKYAESFGGHINEQGQIVIPYAKYKSVSDFLEKKMGSDAAAAAALYNSGIKAGSAKAPEVKTYVKPQGSKPQAKEPDHIATIKKDRSDIKQVLNDPLKLAMYAAAHSKDPAFPKRPQEQYEYLQKRVQEIDNEVTSYERGGKSAAPAAANQRKEIRRLISPDKTKAKVIYDDGTEAIVELKK